MRLSPVEIAERSASYRAVRHAIGRQFRDEYDASQPLPGHLVGLVQRLERDEQRRPKSALVKLVEDAAEKRSRMAFLLSRLSAKKAALVRAIEDACEEQERCRQLMRRMHRSGTGLSWA